VAIYDITVPLTTREPRSGERNGIDYNFVSAETFQLYIDSDQMLEWGEKKGMFYGTLKVTDKDVENAKGRVDNRRKTYKETVNVHPSEQPSASPTAAYQTVDGAEWHETLV
jgi:guanylate kinase